MLYVSTPKPMVDSGGEGEGKILYSQETSMKIVKPALFYIHILVMVLITKERLSQLTLSYCSLFMLNKCNMT